MKIVSVVGARPQFIKAAVVSRALRAVEGLREVLVHTGQHYDDNMSRVFFEELEIPQPDYNLGIGGGTHGQNTGRMLEAIEAVLLKEKPDAVLVYGDTDSTLAGALAAVKLHTPVAHVEAGLRSFNRRMPEEINRVLTDHACDILFAPSWTAVENLLREGIPFKRVHFVGDVMYDAALFYADKAEQVSNILELINLKPKGYFVATVHRAENTDDPERLRVILEALVAIHSEFPVVMPLHPRTKKLATQYGLSSLLQKLKAIDPLGYLDMVKLTKNAQLVLTDSGGLQKEAFYLQVPSVILREETEWVELVKMGWAILSPPSSVDGIIHAVRDLSGKNDKRLGNPYGEGNASTLIQEAIVKFLREGIGRP